MLTLLLTSSHQRFFHELEQVVEAVNRSADLVVYVMEGSPQDRAEVMTALERETAAGRERALSARNALRKNSAAFSKRQLSEILVWQTNVARALRKAAALELLRLPGPSTPGTQMADLARLIAAAEEHVLVAVRSLHSRRACQRALLACAEIHRLCSAGRLVIADVRPAFRPADTDGLCDILTWTSVRKRLGEALQSSAETARTIEMLVAEAS
jgi:uncharacterized protein Yka (UPF0111/DUF47 family)